MHIPREITIATLLTLAAATTVLAANCTPTVSSGETIQDAIDDATSGETICIGVGTYSETLTLVEGVIIEGEELARTIIDGSSTGTIITVAEGSTISNLTIQDGAVGISVSYIGSLTIENVILTDITTAVTTAGSTLTISNTVFYDNTTGLNGEANSVITLINSAFTQNTTDIFNDGTLTLSGGYNLFYSNSTTNYSIDDDTSVFDEDPLFVDPDSNDFHIETGSPAIDVGSGSDLDGTTSDIGAYGETNADVVPFPVSGISATAVSADSLDISWTSNDAYNIAGYNVYFDSDASGETYDGTSSEGSSPVDAGESASITLTGLSTATVASIDVATGLTATPGNASISLSWVDVADASGYFVYYGTETGVYTDAVDVGDTTSHTVTNLVNNTTYYFAVTPYSQAGYYITVSAYDTDDNESALIEEIFVDLADLVEGDFSSEVSEFPESTIALPMLEDEDKCFIATAAYGTAMEPEVETLRMFRNHYLLTNRVGRVFVRVYYDLSPALAVVISESAWLRPVVRAGLKPLIWFSRFILDTTVWIKIILITALLSATAFVLAATRKRRLA